MPAVKTLRRGGRSVFERSPCAPRLQRLPNSPHSAMSRGGSSKSSPLDHRQLTKGRRFKSRAVALALVRGREETYGQIGAQHQGIERASAGRCVHFAPCVIEHAVQQRASSRVKRRVDDSQECFQEADVTPKAVYPIIHLTVMISSSPVQLGVVSVWFS